MVPLAYCVSITRSFLISVTQTAGGSLVTFSDFTSSGHRLKVASLCILLPPGGSSASPVVRGRTWAGDQVPRTSFVIRLGDPSSRPDPDGWRGHAAEVRWTPDTAEIQVTTSLTGFPSLFRVEVDGWTGITTGLEWLRRVPGLRLLLCRRAVWELCAIGFPVEHRTLIHGVSLLPAGQRFRITAERGVRPTERWEPDPNCVFSGLEQYDQRQMATFNRAIASLDLAGARLSLSGGLDTRTIFAGLLRRGEMAPAFSVSGPRLSLDAAIAANLCRRYGMNHDVIVLGDRFTGDLWKLATEASLRSGGIVSVAGAPQVYCYRELGRDPSFSKMLSGGLGTQLGQGGAQAITARPVDRAVLGPEVLSAGDIGFGGEPWYRRGLRSNGTFDPRFLIQEENFFASQAGYLIGQRDAIQVTPYADAELIAAALARPQAARVERRRWSVDPRISEYGRRFFGTGVHSFQQAYIARIGGAVASQPINYGWRARGGVSPRGLMRGGAAFAEDILTYLARRSRAAEAIQATTGLRGFSTHVEVDRWTRMLREPMLDLLGSRHIRHCGVLDAESASRAAASYFAGGSARPDTVVAVADLLLLIEHFGSELSEQS